MPALPIRLVLDALDDSSDARRDLQNDIASMIQDLERLAADASNPLAALHVRSLARDAASIEVQVAMIRRQEQLAHRYRRISDRVAQDPDFAARYAADK
jgi:hypothetical protein